MSEDAGDDPPGPDGGDPDDSGDEPVPPSDDRAGESDGDDAADPGARRERGVSGGDADPGAGSDVDTGTGSDADPEAGSDVDTGTGSDGGRFDGLLPSTRVGQAVLALVVLALVGRLALLGQRTAHWDEGRVAFWALKYSQTGFFEYRPVVHGPFLFQVNSYLFSLLGANDVVARLPVALLGGVLPAGAWLFRERLRGAELVALAGLLAINPLMVYYSRFMRSSVLVAGFMFLALGFVVRAVDSRNGWYAVPAGLCLALGFASKENALVYLVCWFGAGALLLDHRLVSAVRGSDLAVTRASIPRKLQGAYRSGRGHLGALVAFAGLNPLVAFFLIDALPSVLVDPALVVGLAALFGYLYSLRGSNPWHYLGVLAFAVFAFDVTSGLTHLQTMLGYTLFWLLGAALVVDERLFTPPADDGGRGRLGTFPPMLAAYLVTFGALVFFYAPRSPDPGALGFWNAFVNPGMFPDLAEEALLGSGDELWGYWVSSDPGEQASQFPDFLNRMINTLLSGAGLILVASVFGFLYDRWSGDGPRDLVALAGYWGFVSVIGYPYATDIWGGWIAVNVVVPLAIPAAVGLAVVYEVGRDALAADDRVSAALVAVVLLVAISPAAITAVDLAYVNSDSTDRILTDAGIGADDGQRYVIQYAQPGNELKETLATVESVARTHEGTDVLYYGTTPPGSDTVELYVPDEVVCLERPPVHEPRDTCNVPELNWHSRLPVPWYLESYGATVESTLPDADLTEREEIPPVVISRDWEESDLASMLPARYEADVDRFRMPEGDGIVVFVDTSEIPG